MFWTFLSEKAGRDVKTDFYVARRSVSCRKLEISPNLFIFCTYSEKLFARTFWQSCQKCTCIDHSNILRKTIPLKLCFFCFRDIEWTFFCLIAKKAYEVVKTSFYVSRLSFFSVEKLKNAQLFIFFALTAKQICETFLADLSNAYLYCPQ